MALGFRRLFRRRLAAWWTLAVGLAVTGALGWELHREAVEMDRRRLAMRVAEIQSQLDARLEKTEMLLQNLRDYLMLSGERRNHIFARWCYENGLSINCPWIHGIAVATNRNEAQWRMELPNPPETWTSADWVTFCELARRHLIECDIALTSDVKDKKRFLPDYDLKRLLRDKDRLGLTIKQSRLSMSEHRYVMRDSNSNRITGTLFYAPVYKREVADFLANKGVQSEEARWMHLTSVILAPVDFKALVRAVWDGSPSDLGMELFSSTNQTAATWLNISEGVPRATDPKFKAYLTHRQTWPMYGQRFSIFFYTIPLFEAQSPRRLAKVAMAAGTALTLLATALIGVALRARNQQEHLAEQIREARDALAAAQKERNKVNRDLHDGTIQSLYAIQLGLGHTVQRIEAEPIRTGRELSAVRHELDTILAGIRQFITSDVGADQAVDFAAVLRALVHRAQAGTTAEIHRDVEPGATGRLTSTQAVQLANVTREALSNSLRHGQPRRVTVSLRAEREAVVLEISDDGAGFNPKALPRTGIGLASMSSRAREAGGSFEILSSPGKGARVVVRVPVSPAEPAEVEQLDNVTERA